MGKNNLAKRFLLGESVFCFKYCCLPAFLLLYRISLGREVAHKRN